MNALAKVNEIPITIDFVASDFSPLALIGVLSSALVIFGGIFFWLARRKPTNRDRPA